MPPGCHPLFSYPSGWAPPGTRKRGHDEVEVTSFNKKKVQYEEVKPRTPRKIITRRYTQPATKPSVPSPGMTEPSNSAAATTPTTPTVPTPLIPAALTVPTPNATLTPMSAASTQMSTAPVPTASTLTLTAPLSSKCIHVFNLGTLNKEAATKIFAYYLDERTSYQAVFVFATGIGAGKVRCVKPTDLLAILGTSSSKGFPEIQHTVI